MTLDELLSLYAGVSNEAEAILDKIHDNGRITLKPGSPALAVLYGYEEVVLTLVATLQAVQGNVRKAVDF